MVFKINGGVHGELGCLATAGASDNNVRELYTGNLFSNQPRVVDQIGKMLTQ